jgi:hypothetical protein
MHVGSSFSGIVDLEVILLDLAHDTIEFTVQFVAENGWIDSDDDTKELLATVFAVANGRPELAPLLARFLKILAEKRDIRQIVESRIIHDRPGGGLFAFHLFSEGLLDIAAIVQFYRNKSMASGTNPIFRGFAQTVRLDTKAEFFIWFLPELNKTFPLISKWLHTERPELIEDLEQFHELEKDDWKLFKEYRSNRWNPNEFAVAIRRDDVSLLQSHLEQINFEYDFVVPRSLFDGAWPMSLLGYSALWNAVNCVRFLLINQATVNEEILQLAVIGGNTEIIRLLDEKLARQPVTESQQEFERILQQQTALQQQLFACQQRVSQFQQQVMTPQGSRKERDLVPLRQQLARFQEQRFALQQQAGLLQ